MQHTIDDIVLKEQNLNLDKEDELIEENFNLTESGRNLVLELTNEEEEANSSYVKDMAKESAENFQQALWEHQAKDQQDGDW